MDVITIGESMVQLTPARTGRLRHATQFERFVAGAASNVAIGLTRLGHSTGWVSRVGAGEFGACVKAAIRGEGVDVSTVVSDSEVPTGLYFKERRRSSTTRMHYYRTDSAGSRLAPKDIDPEYIGNTEYVHLTGILPALSPTCRETTWTVLRTARDRDVRVSFDPNFRPALWTEPEARDVLQDMVPHIHLISTGTDEATLLTGKKAPEEAARSLLEMGTDQVVIRLEEEGALAIDEVGEIVREPALPVEVVEPVGAGDAFTAGFLSGQLRGKDLTTSLRIGNVLGGLATTAPGDVEALPTWEEVRAHLAAGTA
jgi:2-dehydro-3-deoxygluconokinase